MLSAEFCRAMARYNAWQNTSLLTAADGIGDAARRGDCGAFFGSIFATLNHLLWGDRMWMSRLGGWDRPQVPGADSTRLMPDWDSYRAARVAADAGIVAWANGLTDADLQGDLTWYSGLAKADLSKPRWICVQQFYNHQTHHRGQVHAMLTAAGARPDDTDFFLLPDPGEAGKPQTEGDRP